MDLMDLTGPPSEQLTDAEIAQAVQEALSGQS
jgi:hypothetical protein